MLAFPLFYYYYYFFTSADASGHGIWIKVRKGPLICGMICKLHCMDCSQGLPWRASGKSGLYIESHLPVKRPIKNQLPPKCI